MNAMTNKTRLEEGAKVIALFVLSMLTIITCVAVWVHCPEAWIKWTAGFLFAGNGLVIYTLAMRVKARYATDESTKKVD